jgi:drug/metabolite transporter (DMT)-like permease
MSLNIDTFYGIFAILIWSTTVAIVRSISRKGSAVHAGAVAFLLSGLICIIFMMVNQNFASIVNHSSKYLLVCGTLFVIYTLALFVAIDGAKDNQQAMELGLINYLWPSTTVALSIILTAQKATYLIIPGILISLVGIFIVVSRELVLSWNSFTYNIRTNVVAYLAALIAAITWALYSNLTNLWANPNAESAVFVFIPLTGLVFFLYSSLFLKNTQSVLVWEKKTRLEVLYFGISTIVSYIFWDLSIRRADVTFVAILSYFTPFFSTIVVSIYHKESFSRKLWSGCILIILGSILSWASIWS